MIHHRLSLFLSSREGRILKGGLEVGHCVDIMFVRSKSACTVCVRVCRGWMYRNDGVLQMNAC